eukprot:jgi/Mesvir1/2288/Mv19326-RA.1
MPLTLAVPPSVCWPVIFHRPSLRHPQLPASKRNNVGHVYLAVGSCHLGKGRLRLAYARSSLADDLPGSPTSARQGGGETAVVAASILEERGIPFITDGAFYRDGSIISRDLALLAVAVHAQRLGRRDLRVLDAMAGCGVRALRYGTLDCVSFVWANDASIRTHRALVTNLGSIASERARMRSTMTTTRRDTGLHGDADAGPDHTPGGGPARGCDVRTSKGDGGRQIDPTNGSLLRGDVPSGSDQHAVIGAAPSTTTDGSVFDSAHSEEGHPPLAAWGGERWMGQAHVTDESGRWRVTHADVTKLLMHCYQSKDYFDVVDVDAFGSNITAVEAAVDAVRHGGLLYLTATDGFVAGGHRAALSLAKYGSHTVPVPFANEQGIRVLIGAAARAAAVRGKQVIPVFSLYSQHGPVFRALLRVEKQRDPAWLMQNHRFLACCPHCEETRAVAWDRIAQSSVCTCEAAVASPGGPYMTLTGPMWAGPLHSTEDLLDMQGLVRAWGWQAFSSPSARQGKHTLEQLLELMRGEADTDLKPGYVWLKELSSKGRLSKVTHRGDLIEALRKEGFKACRSHIEPNVIKTNAPVSTCIQVAVQIHKK